MTAPQQFQEKDAGVLRPELNQNNESQRRRDTQKGGSALIASTRQNTSTRPSLRLALLVVPAVFLAALFLGLGVWQVQRLAWKLDLIERVDARLAVPAVEAPSRSDWPFITAEIDEYRKLHLVGRFDNDRATLVQAVTERGGGFWLITPLTTAEGDTYLVNRGFVPTGWDAADETTPPQGEVTVNGLLRFSEPGGGFLRSNDPAANRWYSRDVAAISAAQGLTGVAPFFIDGEASPSAGRDAPQGGMTVVRFRNNHLVYALTWFALALGTIRALIYVLRHDQTAQSNNQ